MGSASDEARQQAALEREEQRLQRGEPQLKPSEKRCGSPGSEEEEEEEQRVPEKDPKRRLDAFGWIVSALNSPWARTKVDILSSDLAVFVFCNRMFGWTSIILL